MVLEEVPDVTYHAIGGLAEQIETIQDAIELPYVHKERFRRYDLAPPKGVLLYGPPGCGKTLIAKAVANSLAKAVAEKEGRDDARSYFLNIKGPELLNKYVGETERQDSTDLSASQREVGRRCSGDRVFRRDGLTVSHPRYRRVIGCRVDDRPAAAFRIGRCRNPQERHCDWCLEPRGPDRPGDSQAGTPRCEDQDRETKRTRRRPDLQNLSFGRCPVRRGRTGPF